VRLTMRVSRGVCRVIRWVWGRFKAASAAQPTQVLSLAVEDSNTWRTLVARKRVNRNPFNEKLIHRYLLEVFYGIHGSDRAAINQLLPPSLHHSSINLVVPEAHLPKKGYRPDLTLYFRGHKKAIPVEVKWTSAGTPGHQLKYLQQNEGVLVSMDAPEGKSPHVHRAQIEWAHFQEWFARSSLRLLRDAFQPDRVDGSEWIVVLRGEPPRINFARMLASVGLRSSFWAFKNNPTSIRSVMELAKGDRILFLFASTVGAGEGRNYEGNKLMLSAAHRRHPRVMG
jgi:hypothetical protein